jgi:CO dehydrogenase/acetyl-CoA synthase beta subunit
MKSIKIPVSAGELIDKITILEIKARHIKDRNKLERVLFEIKQLNKVFTKIQKQHAEKTPQIEKLKNNLYRINRSLWKTEDSIRTMEAKNNFGDKFIKLARTIYKKNDERSTIKNKISSVLGSKLSDIKLYRKYK